MAVLAGARAWPDVPGPPERPARLARPIASVIRAAWRVRVRGLELIPRQGPVILAANHTAVLDGPLLHAVVPRPVHALVKQEVFVGALGWALRACGQIPLDRFAYDVAAVKSCLAVLHRGGALGIYPEGTRGAGDFTRTKPGVAYFALCTGAPIVPVAGLGVRGPAGTVGSLPPLRSAIDVVFGEPITIAPVGRPRTRRLVEKHAADVTERLQEHVRAACALTGRELPGPRHRA